MSDITIEDLRIYPLTEVYRFVKDCFVSLGTPEVHAEAMAHLVSEADYRGHYCEGLNRLESYVAEIREGGCDKDAVPTIIKETASTALVDGNNGLGPVVANFCMTRAIEKAKNSGVGWVVARGSNHFGIAGFYSLKAIQEGLLGISFSNSVPVVAPSGAKEAAVGSNPIAMTAPALNGDDFSLDMATAVVGNGKIELLGKENLPIPDEWACTITGALRPIGGKNPALNYKGSGLAMFVDILCGILSGSAYGSSVKKYGSFGEKANLGHCFVALNPTFFEPGFEERLSDFMDKIRNLEHTDPGKSVLVPGDVEREHMKSTDAIGGIRYIQHIVESCLELAQTLNVEPLKPL